MDKIQNASTVRLVCCTYSVLSYCNIGLSLRLLMSLALGSLIFVWVSFWPHLLLCESAASPKSERMLLSHHIHSVCHSEGSSVLVTVTVFVSLHSLLLVL